MPFSQHVPLLANKCEIDILKAFPLEDGTPYTLNTVMEISSMSKFPTSIAALQLVEKVADDGTPTVRKRQQPITLRRLVTHSSGSGYHFLYEGALERVTVDDSFDLSLLFELGEGWAYGTSIDRVGQVIEKISGLSLEDSTFFPDQNPSISSRRVTMAFRKDPEGSAIEKPEIPTVTTGLKSLLVDDEKILKKETAAQNFHPQLTPASKQELREFMETPDMKSMFPSPPNDRDFGLGGLLIVGDKHEYWRKGALR
ncbi:beta-lactamase family protein [Jackrogersella minutella]|nr:beta-lactamase family protein [Jackrogersella minutella]